MQPQTVNLDPDGTVQYLPFQQFDPALGMLVDVEIDLTISTSGTVTVQNLDATPAQFDAAFLGGGSVTLPSGQIVNAAGDPSLSTTNWGGAATLAAAGSLGSSTVLSGVQGVAGAALLDGDASDLAAMTGSGTIALPLSTGLSLFETGAANLVETTHGTGTATLQLQYDYVPWTTGGSEGDGSEIISTLPNDPYVTADSRIVTETATIADQTPGWTNTVEIAQFDPSLGTLEGIRITLDADITGAGMVENLGTAPGQIAFSDTARVTIEGMGYGAPFYAAAGFGDTAALAGFDGTEDFSGASGRTVGGLTGAGSSQIYLSALDGQQAAFIGSGSVALTLDATGASSVSGVPDLALQLQAQAGARIEVEYIYTPAGAPAEETFSPLDEAPCFAAGTRILTDRGEIDVAALRPGDHAITAAGRRARIVWIGRRTLAPARHPRPWDVNPVHVAPDAFGPGRPHRELRLSPDHAVRCGNALIPVRYLLNDATIVQRPAARITYFHVELERHDLLRAEGLAVESYLDTGNRAAFEGNGALALHPDFARAVWAEHACAPLVTDGPALAEARRRLLTRAATLGFGRTNDPGVRLRVGRRLLAPRQEEGCLVFRLPPAARAARLVSRSTVPAHLWSANADHRRLGIAVTELAAEGAAPVTLTLGAGWYPPGPGLQWTDGDAAITWDEPAATLRLRLAPLLDYWLPRLAA
ncbi:MAG: choice-of-anchor E domain-containing protein [Alphaproteobacteria bacterium]|nr:choice-of-anchor E domain-containing protein [Alphaproteobacteria bacterium]